MVTQSTYGYRRRVWLAGSVLALGIATASAAQAKDILSYARWEKLSAIEQTLVMAGVLDTYDALSQAMGGGLRTHAQKHLECISKAKLSLGELSGNVRKYAQSNPGLQEWRLISITSKYLDQFCASQPD